jgi:hypothetical protein
MVRIAATDRPVTLGVGVQTHSIFFENVVVRLAQLYAGIVLRIGAVPDDLICANDAVV